jgi:hypothetical protein
MNIKTLARHYAQLTARERLLLILGASAREDAVEQQRLMDSAPRVLLEAPHHHGLGQALFILASLQMMTLLDLAAKYQHWLGLWDQHRFHCQIKALKGQVGMRHTNDVVAEYTEETWLRGLARYHALLFITYIEGWKHFCAELPIDADVLLRLNPGWGMVTMTEERAREDAFSREDATKFWHRDATYVEAGGAAALKLSQVPTAEELAKDWHAYLDRHEKATPGTR